MNTRGQITPLYRCILRSCSTDSKLRPKFNFKLDADLSEEIKTGSLKARHHPGVFGGGTVTLPDDLIQAVNTILTDYSVKNLAKEATKLSHCLWSRHASLEAHEYKDKMAQVEAFIKSKETVDPMAPNILEVDRKRLLDSRSSKVLDKMKKETYLWSAIQYDEHKSAAYVVARLAPDFASLVRILREIKKRDTQFSPHTMLDFGSGIGSGMWAVDNIWPGICKEAVCVDCSSEMNNLADKLLRGGDPDSPRTVRAGGTFFKQFLPMSDVLKYDIVLCSRSLFELPDMASRLRTIDILWRKTAGYLIIVEPGTNEGYRLVLEARDYILELSRRASEEEEANPHGYVFSPCAHDMFCPRFFDGSNTPCNFEVNYQPFTFGRKTNTQKDRFSYVVLKQGKRSDSTEQQWPRLVRSPLHRKKHVICRVCTKYGTLQELTVTKQRHGKGCYRLSKNTSWGDLFPVVLPECEPPPTLDSTSPLREVEQEVNDQETALQKEN
ncbi:methyltransferase-like protein 17, mitochondrial [Homarus americanus]|uniref:methyltransferase-like protein 17, mitochondrial n=1 Tax=Homarus americanus TaxID=6706 RepID=UPI001C4837A8|nr:methyltransferase-like protein 17, mitochondrial [Homarus americanus]